MTKKASAQLAGRPSVAVERGVGSPTGVSGDPDGRFVRCPDGQTQEVEQAALALVHDLGGQVGTGRVGT